MIAISVVSGKQSGERFECDEEVISVGRGRSNLIVVDDEHVSFQHGQIALQEGEYVYRDLNSRNGSILVRETRRWKLDRVVPEMKLRQGDRIILGFTELEVAVEAPPTVRPPATKTIRTQRTDLATTDAADAEGVYNALRKDRETLLTIYELERQIHLAPELSGMEQRVLKAVLNVFPEASSVSIGTVQPGSLNITEFASLAAAGQEEEPISQYMARRALQELKAVCAEEVRTERAGTGPVVASSERCVMCAPLWTGSALRGVIQAFGTARPGCFSGRDLDLFTLFANRAATALTNAELNEQRQRTAHFQELTEYLAHELRCAATGLAEWLRPLEDGQFGELRDLQFEAVHTARLGAQMVGTLVTSMTDLAQLRDPGLLLDVAPVGLDEAAELPVRLAGQIAVSRGLATPVHRPRSGLPPVMANLRAAAAGDPQSAALCHGLGGTLRAPRSRLPSRPRRRHPGALGALVGRADPKGGTGTNLRSGDSGQVVEGSGASVSRDWADLLPARGSQNGRPHPAGGFGRGQFAGSLPAVGPDGLLSHPGARAAALGSDCRLPVSVPSASEGRRRPCPPAVWRARLCPLHCADDVRTRK